MAGIKIARGTDPFKKYWWVILVAFGAVGGWICLPALESSGGASASPTAEAGLKTADQSLDAADNPSGAPGSALDMPGAPKRADADGLASSLYQAPGGDVALSTAAAASTGPTFADALKDITRASAARTSASAAAGGWNEAPQRGFTAPKANFGAMSGFGGGSASGASMSASSFGGGGSVSGFGGRGPNTGVSFAKGLQGDDKGEPGVKTVMHSLDNARATSLAGARASSGDAAKGMASATFDGTASTGRIGGGGASVGATGGVYGKLDSAPINLKANDPNLNQSKITPPPMPTPMPAQGNMMQQMMMQLLMAVAMAGVMALV